MTIPPWSVAIVKTNLVTDDCNKILKSEFPEAVVIKHVEILLRGVYCDRALSDVNSTSKIGHWATGSGVLRFIDPRILIAIVENSIDKVMSYRQVVWQNTTVEGNSFKQLKLVESAYERR